MRARASIPSSSRPTSAPAQAARSYFGLMVKRVVHLLGSGHGRLHVRHRRHARLGADLPVQHAAASTRRGRERSWGSSHSVAAVLGMSAGGWIADRLAKIKPRGFVSRPGRGDVRLDPVRAGGAFHELRAGDLRGDFRGRGTDVCQHRALQRDHRQRRAAQPPGGGVFAIAIFAVHFLGDIWSPSLIGKVSDLFGDEEMMAGRMGRVFNSIGAVPTQVAGQPPENIVAGLLVVVPALVLAGILLLTGARHLPARNGLDAGETFGVAGLD